MTWRVVMLWASAVGACMVPFSFGIALGYTSPALPEMISDGIISEDAGSWFSSLMPLAAICGAIAGGQCLDPLGRKLSLILVSVPFVVGWFLILLASSFDLSQTKVIMGLLFSGRLLTGIGTGAGGLISPTYLAEIAPANLRGTIGSLNQLFVTVGIATVYVVGLFLDWKWITVVSLVPPTLLILLMICLPESPRWFLSKGLYQDAYRSLETIREPQFYNINNELEEIKDALENQDSLSARDFLQPRLYRPLVVSLGLMVFQQMSGINALMFNAESIFKSSGFKDQAAAAAILGGVQFAATLLSVLIVDKCGRRLLLFISSLGMMATLVVAGVTDYLPQDLSYVTLAAFLLYVVCFSIGFGPIPWLMMSEVFPNFAKVKASSLATLLNWLCAFIVTKTYHDLKAAMNSYGCYWFYAGWCLLAFGFSIFFVPETKGVPLEQIENLFKSRSTKQPDEETRLLSQPADA